MKRFVTTAIATSCLLILAGSAQAAGEKIILGLGLMHSTADLAANGGGYNSAFDHSELGGRLEFWDMLAENYALNFEGNLGFFNETDKPGTGAPAGAPEAKYSQTSFSIRLGGDKVYSPLENTKVFFGPGLEFWSGKAKFEDIPGFPGTYETKNTKRFSLHGHVGSIWMFGPGWGISGQLGHRIGMATHDENGAKTTWWPSSLDGAMEFVFAFGGK